MMNNKYLLDKEGNPVSCSDLMTWAKSFETIDRRVAFDTTKGVAVSTVFLGLNHNFGDGPPLLFETMVFGGTLNDEQVRYSTREEAIAGHAKMVERVRQSRRFVNRVLYVLGLRTP